MVACELPAPMSETAVEPSRIPAHSLSARLRRRTSLRARELWHLAGRLRVLVAAGLALAACQTGPRTAPLPPPTLSPVPDPAAAGLPADPPRLVAIEFVEPATPRGTMVARAETPRAVPGAPDPGRAAAQQARAQIQARQIALARQALAPLGDLRRLRSRRIPDSFCRSRGLDPGATLTTFFSYPRNAAVYVRMCGDQVVDTRERPGATPAASVEERAEAIGLARRHPQLAQRVADLRAQAILTATCRGLAAAAAPCPGRTLYVTFYAIGEEAPRFAAEVDLGARRVLAVTTVAAPPATARGPRLALALAALDEAEETWSDEINWRGWRLRYAVEEGAQTGLVLEDVTYLGRRYIRQLSLPVIRVKYATDNVWWKPWTWRIFDRGCGPFKDQIDREAVRTIEQPLPAPGVSDHPQPCERAICSREWIDDDIAWLELGIYARIGQYHIYQAWYLSAPARANGPRVPAQIVATVWSGGIACQIDHTHHPYWRLHLDIGGAAQDHVFIRRGERWARYAAESDDLKTTAGSAEPAVWVVRTPTGQRVWIVPGAGDGVADSFSNRDLSVRRYRDAEDEDWEFDYYEDLGYSNGESLDQSVVIWYVAHMAHPTRAESRDRWEWHRAGSTLVLDPGE